MERTVVLKVDFDEILFESRNKSYGAYVNRKKSSYYLERSLLITLLFFLGLFFVPRVINWLSEPPAPEKVSSSPIVYFPDEPMDIADIVAPPRKDDSKAVSPSQKRADEKGKKPQAGNQRVQSDNVQPDKSIKDPFDFMENHAIDNSDLPLGTEDLPSLGSSEGFGNGNCLDCPPGAGTVSGDTFLLPGKDTVTDWGASRPPSMANYEAFKACVGYPEQAQKNGIEGRAVFRVKIDESGKYLRHVVLVQTHGLLLNAAERCLPMLRFTPALSGSKAVKIWVVVPVTFTHTTDEKEVD